MPSETSIQLFFESLAKVPDARVKTGRYGGRTVEVGYEDLTLNKLVQRFSDAEANFPAAIKNKHAILKKIASLDACHPEDKNSFWIWLITRIRQLFGNYFYDRKKELERIKDKLGPEPSAPAPASPKSWQTHRTSTPLRPSPQHFPSTPSSPTSPLAAPAQERYASPSGFLKTKQQVYDFFRDSTFDELLKQSGSVKLRDELFSTNLRFWRTKSTPGEVNHSEETVLDRLLFLNQYSQQDILRIKVSLAKITIETGVRRKEETGEPVNILGKPYQAFFQELFNTRASLKWFSLCMICAEGKFQELAFENWFVYLTLDNQNAALKLFCEACEEKNFVPTKLNISIKFILHWFLAPLRALPKDANTTGVPLIEKQLIWRAIKIWFPADTIGLNALIEPLNEIHARKLITKEEAQDLTNAYLKIHPHGEGQDLYQALIFKTER